ncbi:MAG: hypothetical protein HY318_00875 [Armatimonadetes bacterium]|nr:hypothetical protein [Armatimonadota bacterium]
MLCFEIYLKGKEDMKAQRMFVTWTVGVCLALGWAASAQTTGGDGAKGTKAASAPTSGGCCGSESSGAEPGKSRTPSRALQATGQTAQPTWEEAVKLTLDQKQRLERLDARWRERWQDLNAKVQQTQDQVNALLKSPSSDLSQVKTLVKRQMGYQAELQIGGIEARVSREQSLTPKQRELLAQWQGSSKGGACGCGGSAAKSGASGSGCGGGSGGCGSHASASQVKAGG